MLNTEKLNYEKEMDIIYVRVTSPIGSSELLKRIQILGSKGPEPLHQRKLLAQQS